MIRLDPKDARLDLYLLLLRHGLNHHRALLVWLIAAMMPLRLLLHLLLFLSRADVFIDLLFLLLHGLKCDIIICYRSRTGIKFIRVIYKQIRMRISVLLLAITLLCSVTSIVDRTYFNYLGLKITASADDVQRAYSEKKAKIEALTNEEEKERKSKLLKEAFDTLSNDKERQKYERYGRDVFRTIKEMTCIDKKNPENPRDERKSPSFKLTIPVSIGDIYNGTVIKGKYPKMQACPICQGTGAKSPKDLKPCTQCGNKGFTLRDQQNFYGQKFQAETICPICKGLGKTVAKTCDHCHGSKLVPKMEVIEIPIEKGLPNGNTFTLRNMGEESNLGAPSDFQITVVQVPTEKWSRQGSNLVYLMEITLEQSLFGFTKTFQHLDGSQVTVNRNGHLTTKDTKHIIKEKGILNKQGYAGNLIIRFKVNIPTFSDQQLDMWQDFFNEYPM